MPKPGGYAWWYFDAVSDDGQHALTAIFFVGSVFSPSYAGRLRRGEVVRAEEHLGVNLALYHRGRQVAWVMSEYGESALRSWDAAGPHIAASKIVALADGGLRVEVVDRSAPFLLALAGWGRKVACTIELAPAAPPCEAVELGAVDGTHHGWRMIMPRARVRVQSSAGSWSGDGYHDVNWGDGRLEHAFSHWSWARFHDGPDNVVLYQLEDRGGQQRSFLHDSRRGPEVVAIGGGATVVPGAAAPDRQQSRWGLALPRAFSVAGLTCSSGTMLEATPFYARYQALLEGRGATLFGIGEHLDLGRFDRRTIQFLLRFKIRRA